MEKNSLQAPGPSEQFRFGRECQKLSNHFHRLGDENLAKEGITFSQLRVLGYISRHGEQGEVYQRDLEQDFGVRRSSITSILQNMEKSGLLKRCGATEDARIKKITLTSKGKDLDERLRSYIHGLEADMMKGFSQEEKELLYEFLLRMSKNLKEAERSRL